MSKPKRELPKIPRKGPPPGVAIVPGVMKGLGRAGRKKLSKAARSCIAEEISRHCRKKRGKCRRKKARTQAIAIGFSVCRRKGFKVPPAP